MRTIKRGGEFVWRNYMYNAFERKRERWEREREDEDSRNGGEWHDLHKNDEFWMSDWRTRVKRRDVICIWCLQSWKSISYIYIKEDHLYSGGLAPQTRKAEHVEGCMEGGETRGRKGHVGEKAMSVKRPCILQTTRYVLPKRILSENLSFVTCSVRARKKSTRSWKMS